MPKKAKSAGPPAPWVIEQVQLGAKGSFRTFPSLEEARKCLEAFDDGTESRFLWCKCGVKLGTRKNVWQRHVSSESHKEGMAKSTKQVHLGAVLVDQVAEQAKRQRLADELVAHRVRVARAVFSTSLSVNEVEQDGELKELLQEHRPRRLPIGSHLAEDTKESLARDIGLRYTAEFRGRPLLLTFDSTPRRDDVCAVLFSFVDDKFNVVDRLATLRLFGASLNGSEYVDVILSSMETYGVARQQIVFCNSDRGGANKPCIRALLRYCPKMTQIWCIPHTLNRVGVKVKFPVLVDFQAKWNAVFKHSGGAQNLFSEVMKQSWVRKSKVKWWTSFEQCEQIFAGFAHVGKVLEKIKAAGYCKATIAALSALWATESDSVSDLAFALAGQHDVLHPFVVATHFLESGEFIAPYVTDTLSGLVSHTERILSAQDCPVELANVYALLMRVPGHQKRSKWQKVQQAVRPGLAYYYELFCNFKEDNTDEDDAGPVSFREACDVFRFARIFHPAHGLKFLERYSEAGGQVFGEWRAILVPKVVTSDAFDALERDLPLLVAPLTASRDQQLDAAELSTWWQANGPATGAWLECARVFMLCRPSSALAERLFSVHLAALASNMLGAHEGTQQLRTQLNFERVTGRKTGKK